MQNILFSDSPCNVLKFSISEHSFVFVFSNVFSLNEFFIYYFAQMPKRITVSIADNINVPFRMKILTFSMF